MTNERTAQAIEALNAGNTTEFADAVTNDLMDRVAAAVESQKQDVAASMFSTGAQENNDGETSDGEDI